jgi:hypothetical protein
MLVKRVPWPDAIERVLQASEGPLTGTEIARRATFEGWARPSSQWPSNSVSAAVYGHIKTGHSKGFKIISHGRNALPRFWLIRRS